MSTSVSDRLYANHCAMAYIQWFEGFDLEKMSPEQLTYRQRQYEEACRRGWEHYMSDKRGRKGADGGEN